MQNFALVLWLTFENSIYYFQH